MTIPQPILAFDPGGIMCVATIVMMFVGWILNLVNNNKNRQAPPARRGGGGARAGNDRLQSEIDSFLQEVGGGKRRVQPDHEPEELELEIVEEAAPTRRPRRKRPQSRPVERSRPAAPPVNTPLSERHLESTVGSSHLGSDLQEHVNEYMRDHHIDETETGGQESRIGSDWTKRGGTSERTEDNTGTPDATPFTGGIADLLRNPATVRQAILITEVLSPPKSRRR